MCRQTVCGAAAANSAGRGQRPRIASGVPSNVDLFINLYQGTNLIGGGAISPAADFRESGRHKASAEQILHHINYCTLAFCGFNVHEPYIALNVLGLGREGHEKQLQELEYRLNNLLSSPQWATFYN